MNKNTNKNINIVSLHIGDKTKRKRKRRGHKKPIGRSYSGIVTYIKPSMSLNNIYSKPSVYTQPTIQPTINTQDTVTQPTNFTSNVPVTEPTTFTSIVSNTNEEREKRAAPAEARANEQDAYNTNLQYIPPTISSSQHLFSHTNDFEDANTLNEPAIYNTEPTPQQWDNMEAFNYEEMKEHIKQELIEQQRQYNNMYQRNYRAHKAIVNKQLKAYDDENESEKTFNKPRQNPEETTSPAMTRKATRAKHIVDEAIEQGHVTVRKKGKKEVVI